MRTACLGAVLFATPALAFDPVSLTAPQKWIDATLPEKGKKLEKPEYFNALDTARQQYMAGRYKAALYTLYKAPADLDATDVAVLKAKCLTAIGRVDEALSTLEPVKTEPKAMLARADALESIGKVDEAMHVLRDLLAAHADSIAGHYQLGALAERMGDLKLAEEQFGWFFADPQHFQDKWFGQPDSFNDAAEVTRIARAFDRHSQITGAYKGNPQLHNMILNMFVRAYDTIDRTYWPARLAAAEYFLSHDNEGEAKEELTEILKVNPNDEAALAMTVQLLIGDFAIPQAEAYIDRMRSVNPNSVAADLLESAALLRTRQPEPAAFCAQRALDKQPKNLDAIGLLASAAAYQLDNAKVQAMLKQADTIAPASPTVLATLADNLHDAWQYERAETYYNAAIERADWWATPRHRLGKLYAENGEEDKARAALDAAYAIDPFNVETVNYLKLLDELATFDKRETEHFILVYDKTRDPVTPEYMGDVMEAIYKEICGDFKYEPTRKIIVEIFPTKDSFSVRIAGQPGAETYAAAFGPVIAACTPRSGGTTLGLYNWPRVLKHEFTHTINLAASEYRVPRWLTEGLATWEEDLPIRFQKMGPVMFSNTMAGTLFRINEMASRITRPQKPNDGEMVYTQGAWLARYLEATFGRDSIVKVIDGYKRGKTDAVAFKEATGKSPSEIDSAFAAWMKEQLKSWGYDDASKNKYDELLKNGEDLVQAKKYDEALPVWQELATLRPVETLPHQRLAGLYLRVNQSEKAIEHLIELNRNELKDNRYAKRVSRMYRDEGKLDEALKYALEGIYRDAYDSDAHELLAQIYEKLGDTTAVEREQRMISAIDRWKSDQMESITPEQRQ